MKYYADKEKKYIGGSDHGEVVPDAVLETLDHPEIWNEETDFKQIAEFETETEAEGGEDLGKPQA